MTLRRLAPLALAALVATGSAASAFCGFYVATSDEPLTNRASRIVLVHDAGHTVVTMASDVHGDPRQFALVIPVPTVIRRDQVRVVAPETVEHLAEYTKPRLVQYYDEAPCRTYPPPAPAPVAMAPVPLERRAAVRVKAAFSVAEYDIQVLSADDSDGLIGWLNRNGYRMPEAAGPVVGSYIAQGIHFFVANVNLDRAHDLLGGFLHPIRVTYETPKFMLPIRLGTVNASGPQDMIVLALTRTGRVDVTNYRTLRMPTGQDVPEYVADRFSEFYDAAFDHEVAATGGNAVLLEYAWPVSAGTGALCDPCSAPPLSQAVFDEVGASWDVSKPSFITHLHVRYDRAHFPEDLQFQETPDTETFQARYVVHRHIVRQSELRCSGSFRYTHDTLPRQWAQEQANLIRLTGWNRQQVHADMLAQWNKARAE